MATLISCATGNFLTASTWKVCSAVANAEVDSDQQPAHVVTTANFDSDTFVLAATNVDAVAIKISAVIAPTGTLSVILRNSTTSINVATVTINCSDLRVDAQGWFVFSFSAHTPNGTDSYLVRITRSVTDSASNRITIYGSSAATTSICRLVRLVTTATPATNDKLTIAGEFTGAGASTPYTVTMNALESTYTRSAQFIPANAEHLTIDDNASLSTGDIDFWMAGWVYLDLLTTDTSIMGKDSSVASGREYRMYYSANKLNLMVFNAGVANISIPSTTSVVIGTWYFFMAYHDSVNNLLGISINNEAFATLATSAFVPFDGLGKFQVGARAFTANEAYWPGRLTALAFGKNPVGGLAGLANAIKTSLYNSGSVKYYSSLTGAEKTNWGLISFWNLDEYSAGTAPVTRNDSHGTNHLTDINTVASHNVANVSSYGPVVSGGPPQGITVNDKSTLTWGTSASTNYYLKWKGILGVYPGGTMNVGTSGTRLPSTSTAVLDMDIVANVDTGLEIKPGGVANLYGDARCPTSVITGATAATPIEITSTSHGLVAGERVAIQGVAGGSARFTTTTQYLSAPANAANSTGDIDFWVASWIYPESFGVARIFIEKGYSPLFEFYAALSSNTLAQFTIYTPAGSSLGTATYTGSFVANTWYFVVAYHDSVNNLVGISVNGGAFQTSATTGAPTAGAGLFYLGRPDASTWNGQIDSACFGKSPPGGIAALTTAIRDSLYNSGSGKVYSELTSPEKTDWGLISWWELDEPAGFRNDSHGANHLADVNNVTRVAGRRGLYGADGTWEVIASTGANTFTIGAINGGVAGAVGTSTGVGTYTSGGTWQRVPYTWLTADLAVAGTVCTVLSTTCFRAGDEVCFGSTTRTYSQCEKRAILTVDSATQITLTDGVTFAHSGTVPTRAEVGLLTRNVKVKGASPSWQGYIFSQTTGSFIAKDIEFYWLGSAVANKYSITSTTTTGIFDLQHCALHDFIFTGSYGVLFSGSTGSPVIARCVFYNIYQYPLSIGVTSGTPLIDGNLCILVLLGSSSMISLGDIGGVITNNIMVGSAAAGLAFTEHNNLGTISGNTIHSCGATSLGLNGYTAANGMIANTYVWRTFAGPNIIQANINNLIISNMTSIGNVTTNFTIGSGVNIILDGLVLAGDTTFSTPTGVTFGSTAYLHDNIVFENCSFGVTSGILVPHTTADFAWVASTLGRATLRNCLLGSTTELSGQLTMLPGSYLASQKHDQVVGNHKTYKREGTLSTDTAIYATASPSLRMKPAIIMEKLNSIKKFGFRWPVLSGSTLSVSIKIRKSVSGDGSTYSGGQPRFILKRNVLIGINSDIVLATATNAANGTFITYTATTPVATAAGVMEFYVDCDGTSGWINVDDFSVV